MSYRNYLRKAFKEISSRLDRNATTFSKEVRKYSSEVTTDILDILTMFVKIESTAGIRMCVARKYEEDNNLFYSSINHKLNIIDHRIKYIEKR